MLERGLLKNIFNSNIVNSAQT